MSLKGKKIGKVIAPENKNTSQIKRNAELLTEFASILLLLISILLIFPFINSRLFDNKIYKSFSFVK